MTKKQQKKMKSNMNTSKEEKSANYLEFIPVVSEDLKYETDSSGCVTIFKENIGIFHFIAQKLFKKPRVSQIHLDEMGNFIWPLLDGKNDILIIGEAVKEAFGEKASPLYERLIQYLKTMESYGFIQIKSPNSSEK